MTKRYLVYLVKPSVLWLRTLASLMQLQYTSRYTASNSSIFRDSEAGWVTGDQDFIFITSHPSAASPSIQLFCLFETLLYLLQSHTIRYHTVETLYTALLQGQFAYTV